MKFLLKYQADKERKDSGGNTPLQIAQMKGNKSIIELLNKERSVDEDVLAKLINETNLAHKLANIPFSFMHRIVFDGNLQESLSITKKQMGLMQAILTTKIPSCITILPTPAPVHHSASEFMSNLIYDRFRYELNSTLYHIFNNITQYVYSLRSRACDSFYWRCYSFG